MGKNLRATFSTKVFLFCAKVVGKEISHEQIGKEHEQ